MNNGNDNHIIIFIAALGGTVRYLISRDREKPITLGILLGEFLIAGFAGVVTSFILSSFDISPHIKAAGIAMAGYCAREVLDIFSALFLKKIDKQNK